MPRTPLRRLKPGNTAFSRLPRLTAAGSTPADAARPACLRTAAGNERLHKEGEETRRGVIQAEEAEQCRSGADRLGGARLKHEIEQRRAYGRSEYKPCERQKKRISLQCVDDRRFAFAGLRRLMHRRACFRWVRWECHPQQAGAQEVQDRASIKMTACAENNDATRSANSPPRKPPSVPNPLIFPKTVFADLGSNDSFISDQNAETSTAPNATSMHVNHAGRDPRTVTEEHPLGNLHELR